jgi:hypothetical protein
MKKVLFAALSLLALTVFACGDEGSDDDGSSGSSSDFSCCLNGEFYDCPTSEAVGNCSLTTGPGTCTRDSSRDSTCGS